MYCTHGQRSIRGADKGLGKQRERENEAGRTQCSANGSAAWRIHYAQSAKNKECFACVRFFNKKSPFFFLALICAAFI